MSNIDPWANDPDRTTRNQAWKDIEESALAVANDYAPISIKTLTPPPAPKRKLSPWLVTAVLGLTLLSVVLAFIGAAS